MSAVQHRLELKLLQQMLGLVPNESFKAIDKDVVFVSIDCEAHEHAQNKITEVGVAVLDTRDVAGMDDDTKEEAWFSKMKYAHYRPIEYAKLINRSYIKGCPEQFGFGSSSWIKLADMGPILKRIFQSPTQLLQAGDFSVVPSEEKRNVIFVAHGASNDKAYLKKVGFDMTADAVVSRTMDTQVVASGSKKHSIALRRLLLSLGSDPVNLHNAGNDAAYTLQALVVMALRDLKNPGCVPVDLAKHAGKMPPEKHNSRCAPQVWVGTATRPGGLDEVRPAATKPVVLPGSNPERRRRKRAARAARDAQGTENTEDTNLAASARAITDASGVRVAKRIPKGTGSAQLSLPSFGSTDSRSQPPG
ncbi:hypothetical protein LTR08_004642 [Meristemomyces frigidus]|nr:hypothetical protein LTR08_004642 [Meristemomyces frigidus]